MNARNIKNIWIDTKAQWSCTKNIKRTYLFSLATRELYIRQVLGLCHVFLRHARLTLVTDTIGLPTSFLCTFINIFFNYESKQV